MQPVLIHNLRRKGGISSGLAGIFQIRPGEKKLVGLVSGLFACLEAVRGISANTADSLFFVRYGVQHLPGMYIVLGTISFAVVFAYMSALGRIPKNSFFSSILFLFSLAILLQHGIIAIFHRPVLYPVLWVSVYVINTILVTLMWNIAVEVSDARQARRLFSLYVSAGILGGVMGNFLTGQLAKRLGTVNLLMLCAGLLLLGAGLSRLIAHQFFQPPIKKERKAGLITEMRVGYDFARRSRLMRLILISSILFSILNFSVSFPFSKIVSASFNGETDVANFLGIFTGAITAVTFLVSLLAANRLFARIGMVNANLILPLTYLFGFILLSASYTLVTAMIVRMAQMVILMGISNSAWGALFNVVPVDKRSQVQSFSSGLPEQIGIALTGFLLILGQRILSPMHMFLVGIIIASLCSLFIWQMRSGYGQALMSNLRAGMVDVFMTAQRALPHPDANTRQTVLSGLSDPNPNVRRISVELAEKLDLQDAIEPVKGMLADVDLQVRRAAAEALFNLAPSEHLYMMEALSDPDPDLRARAAIALYRSGEKEIARSAITAMLGSPSPDFRSYGLEACSRLRTCLDSVEVASFLSDDVARVRSAAIQALGSIGDEFARQILLTTLDSPEEHIRREAAFALRSSQSAWSQVVEVLNTGSEHSQDAALLALVGSGRDIFPAVISWAMSQIPRANQFHNWYVSIKSSPASAKLQSIDYLSFLLQQREVQITQRILQALALVGPSDALQLASRCLRYCNREMRSQALETIDTLGDKRITRGLVPLLEGTRADAPREMDGILNELAEQPDTWLQVLAERARRDIYSGGSMTETAQTLGILDRILFLRLVPIFSELGPDDLQRLAEIASEQVIQSGDYLCREGEFGDEMFVIVEGQVRVTRKSDHGERTLRTAGIGDHIGEFAILRGQPRSANVIADGSSTRVLVISGEALKSILRDRPEVAMAMLANLADRLSSGKG